METLRVLIIEQSEEVGTELVRLAVRLGTAPTLAIGVAEALTHLHALSFDVIIADHAPPATDALALLDQVQLNWSYLPMIMLTSFPAAEQMLEAYQRGMCVVLYKPVNIAWLAVAFQHVAERVELQHLRTSQAISTSGDRVGPQIAHAIINPLSVILGLAQLMLSNGELPTPLRADMQLLTDHALQLSAIVRGLAYKPHSEEP